MSRETPTSVTAVAPDIYQVGLPLPFALNRINAYLLRDPQTARWTIVDTGLHTDAGEAVWRSAFDMLEIVPGMVEQIILTHMHPDHYGMAGWLQAHLTTADQVPPVAMSPIELAAARRVWIERGTRAEDIGAHLLLGGIPLDRLDEIIRVTEETAQRTAPHPTQLVEIAPGSMVHFGGRVFTTMQHSGHADGHLMFYDAAARLLLCGDHVLNKITPNIGLWHDTQPDPLRHFLASLAELRDLPVELALPGHKTLITDWRGRVDALIAHHHTRLDAARAAATGLSAYEIGAALFPSMDRFSVHELRFAVAEALAHLEYLRERGEVVRSGAVVWRYTRS